MEPGRVRTPLCPVQQPGKRALKSEPQQKAGRPELSRIADRLHHGRPAVGIKPISLQFASVSDPDLLIAPDPPATNVETTAKAATAPMATAPGVAAAAASIKEFVRPN